MSETSAKRASQSKGRRPERWPRILPWLLILVGGLVWLIWSWQSHWWTPITAVDISQERANIILPAPNSSRQIRQDFVARKDGLYQVELLLAVQGESQTGALLELQLLDPTGRPIAARPLDSQSVDQREPFALIFPPQKESAGQRYTVQIAGTDWNGASVWGYDLESYEAGQLRIVGGESAGQELRFVTRYQLSAGAAIEELARLSTSSGGLILLTLAFVLMPGALLLQNGRFTPEEVDPLARFGLALALGASMWPIVWLWLTVIGGNWAVWSLWLALIAGWATFLAIFVVRRLRSERASRPSPRAARFSWHHGLLLLILCLGMAGRLLAVRDLAFPPWVDSSRHALITTVMADNGQTISSYRPLLPVDDFPYHFGFHTLSASLMMLVEQPLPDLLLMLGQLFNGLVPLTIYAAAYLLTRRRSVGLLAAFLVALPFFFPAYYATWGRMTQITAVMVSPLALALTWLVLRGARSWRRAWPLLGLLVAGLFLIHFRVFVLYVPFAALAWLLSRGRQGRWLALAAGSSLILVAPHLIRLLGYASPAAIGDTIAGYNDFPLGYVTVGWERGFLVMSAAAALIALLAAFRRRNWSWLPLLIIGWILLTGGLLASDRLGLWGTTVVNLNSSYIVAFLPIALLLATVADRTWRWLQRRHLVLDTILGLIIGAALAASILFGLRQQITILNEVTILAWTEDEPALSWLDENLPDEATVAVNSWLWLGSTYAASDGGAWIVQLTGRSSTTPPADYIYSQPLAQRVNRFNGEMAEWSDWSDPAAAQWLSEQGVTHIYVGAKGGNLDPASLSRNPLLSLLYGRDGVFIFEVK